MTRLETLATQATLHSELAALRDETKAWTREGRKGEKASSFLRCSNAQPVQKLPTPATQATTRETILNQKMDWF